MAFQKIMVPFDGSELATKALNKAIELSDMLEGSSVCAVSIIYPGSIEMGMGSFEAYEASLSSLIEKSRAKVTEQLNEVIPEGTEVTIETVTDHSPVRGIIRYAEENNIDLIIMGHRGMGPVRALLGSVSLGVLSDAKCPVMTVK